jgi:hypothetical protein
MGMLLRFLKSSNSSWVLEPVLCPSCRTTNVVKNGKSDEPSCVTLGKFDEFTLFQPTKNQGFNPV